MTLTDMLILMGKSIATEIIGGIGWTIYLYTILWIMVIGIALVF